MNDIADRRRDQMHETKRKRPVASGIIFPAVAAGIALFAGCAAAAYASYFIPSIFPYIAVYALWSLVYSFLLKRIPVVEIAAFPVFYAMRIMAGGVAAGIPVSQWLVLCTMFLSFFLVAVKRRGEGIFSVSRPEHAAYSATCLERMVSVSLASILVSYGIYAVLGTRSSLVVYSVIFAAIGLFRYADAASHGGSGIASEEAIIRDPIIFGSVVAWLAYMCIVLYFPRS